jgi:uncharacterized Zn-binding protein involved in type VI secretion
MGKPAARISDMHTCPMVTPGLPPIPHVGGPIVGPGCPTVLIGGMPASVIGDMCTCVGPPDTIAMGSTGVFIGGKPAARMGDQCIHGGAIMMGCPTVLIGETGTAQAASSGSDVSSVLMNNQSDKNNKSFARSNNNNGKNSTKEFDNKRVQKDSIACLVKDEDGNSLPGIKYEIKLPSGEMRTGVTDSKGEINIHGIEPGTCEVNFPDLHQNEWNQS